MPTAPESMKNAVMEAPEFWADHSAELSERFNGWLAELRKRGGVAEATPPFCTLTSPGAAHRPKGHAYAWRSP